MDEEDDYRPTSRRQRWGIVVATLVTVAVLWALLLYRPGGHPRVYPETVLPPCTAGQMSGCVGGQVNVTLIAPAASAASR